MDYELEIIKPNASISAAGDSFYWELKPGVYFLDESGILASFWFTVPANNSHVYAREEFLQGLGQCTMVEKDTIYNVQNLSALQALWYYNSEFYKETYGTALDNQVISGGNLQQNQIYKGMFTANGHGECNHFYKWARFFPGETQPYLVLDSPLVITIQENSLTGLLISQNVAGTAQAAMDLIGNAGSPAVQYTLIMKKANIEIPDGENILPIIESQTSSGTSREKTYILPEGYLSQFSGFLIEDTNETALTSCTLTPQNNNAMDITLNDMQEIQSTTYENGQRQFNALRSSQEDENVFGVVFNKSYTNTALKYNIQTQLPNNVQITTFIEKVKI